MAKKISELTKELDISYQELKKTADTMGIEVKSARGSLAESDASRISDTINKLKGKATPSKSDSGKPKIKAVPIINKDLTHRPKPPAGKPIVPKDFADRPKKQEEPAEESKAASLDVQEKPTAERESKPEVKAEAAPKKTEHAAEETVAVEKAAAVKKPAEKAAKAEKAPKEAAVKATEAKAVPAAEQKAEEKPAKAEEKPQEPKKEEYVNAPNKPMRFKKIFDATTAPKPEEKPARRKPGEKRERTGTRDNKGQGGRFGGRKPEDGRGGKDGGSRPAPRRGAEAAPAPSADVKGSSKGKSKKFFDKNKDKFKNDKYGEGGSKGRSRYFDERSLEKQTRHKRKNRPKPVEPQVEIEELLPEGTVAVVVPITVAGFAEQAEISSSKIIMSLMKLGIMATINQTLDKDTVEMLADDLGISVVVTEEQSELEEPGLELHEDADSELKPRAPIITVMGHVDHGKTSLLDAIRNTNVTAGESGGITQHIGASEVKINGKKIVFLDTPGHEAFTTMRARGAQVTDIAVLVVAADDSVKPQTIESISHAKAANVPIIVAINKMDKPGANPDRVKKDLAEHGVLVEDWGGDVISVPVSAKKGEGITDLLEMVLLQAEVLELKANPDRLALGTVIEARLDKAKGPIATLLVTNGTLKTGQSVVAGTCSGKIRVMTNFRGEKIRKALPATPVEILGLSDVPMAGDAFNAVKDDKQAREIAENRKEKMREEVLARNASTTLEKLFSQIKEGETKQLNLIIKGDVQGSVGAIISSLEKLDRDDVRVRVIHSGVGTVTESDVMLAETSSAIIIGFNVRPTTAVQKQADDANIEIRTYRVIYDIIDEVENAMKGMLDPEFKEEVLGKAEIRETFKVPNIGIIGGAYVIEGKMQRNAEVRLVRDGIVIHEGKISSLRRFKDDVKEVAQNYECGIGIEAYNDIKPSDVIECFHMVEIER